jgi:hypothetical protein
MMLREGGNVLANLWQTTVMIQLNLLHFGLRQAAYSS